MKDLKTVINFTIKEMLNRKSFIISTIVILLIIVIGFNIPNIINAFVGDDESFGEVKLLIVDSAGFLGGNEKLLESMELSYKIEATSENVEYEEIKSKIENAEIDEAIIIEKGEEGKYEIRYIVENTATVSGVPEEILNSIISIYSQTQLINLGLSEAEIMSLTPTLEYSIEQTEEQEVNGNIYVIVLVSLVLFYAIYFCAYQVSTSITTEKTSKIVETLVTSTSPKTIVLGKTIGVGIVGLLQVCLLVVVALMSANLFLEPGTLESVIDMSQMTPYLAIVSIIYFILGYCAYALLYALTGSTVAKPEDIQSANTPVALLSTIAFYLAYFTMIVDPTGSLNAFAAMFPLSAPFCMPLRIMLGIASVTDVIISIAILIILILIIAKVAIKIYSNAILNYGTRMTIKDMIKTYKDKNN